MISPRRIAEILAQCQREEVLMVEGEESAYQDFFMDLPEDVSYSKAIVYIESEIKRLGKYKEDPETSYDDWQRARGGITGLSKIREAMAKYGE